MTTLTVGEAETLALRLTADLIGHNRPDWELLPELDEASYLFVLDEIANIVRRLRYELARREEALNVDSADIHHRAS